jgi:putative transcriptional regulator
MTTAVRAIAATPVMAALVLAAGLPSRAAQRDVSRDLAAGKILVADAKLVDRHFARSVVVLLSYAKDGAAGLVLNQQTTLPVQRVVPDLPVPRGATPVVFLGGPVSLPDVRALVRTPAAPAGALRVLEDVYFLSTAASLDQTIQRGIDPSRIRLYAGYAGWSAGQLDDELRRGDWHVLDGSSDLVFDADPLTLWRRALRLTDVVVL